MKTEKAMAAAAVVISILALIFSLGTFAPAKPLPPDASVPDLGGYIGDYEAKIALLKHMTNLYEEKAKHGQGGRDEAEDARLECDKARLALQRLKTGRRTFPTFVDSLLQRQLDRVHLTRKSESAEANACRLKQLETELRLKDQTRRVDAGTVSKVEEIIRNHPAAGLTDAQIAELVELEPVWGGR